VNGRLLIMAGCAWFAIGCDAVPDLFVTDASLDGSEAEANAAFDAGDAGQDAAGDAQDAGPEACPGVSCPGCAPNPGMCCASGVACLGSNCATDCTGGCLACTPSETCCSKQGGQPVCRNADGGGGKCPP
jgi:hypothetical protein